MVGFVDGIDVIDKAYQLIELGADFSELKFALEAVANAQRNCTRSQRDGFRVTLTDLRDAIRQARQRELELLAAGAY